MATDWKPNGKMDAYSNNRKGNFPCICKASKGNQIQESYNNNLLIPREKNSLVPKQPFRYIKNQTVYTELQVKLASLVTNSWKLCRVNRSLQKETIS